MTLTDVDVNGLTAKSKSKKKSSVMKSVIRSRSCNVGLSRIEIVSESKIKVKDGETSKIVPFKIMEEMAEKKANRKWRLNDYVVKESPKGKKLKVECLKPRNADPLPGVVNSLLLQDEVYDMPCLFPLIGNAGTQEGNCFRSPPKLKPIVARSKTKSKATKSRDKPRSKGKVKKNLLDKTRSPEKVPDKVPDKSDASESKKTKSKARSLKAVLKMGKKKKKKKKQKRARKHLSPEFQPEVRLTRMSEKFIQDHIGGLVKSDYDSRPSWPEEFEGCSYDDFAQPLEPEPAPEVDVIDGVEFLSFMHEQDFEDLSVASASPHPMFFSDDVSENGYEEKTEEKGVRADDFEVTSRTVEASQAKDWNRKFFMGNATAFEAIKSLFSDDPMLLEAIENNFRMSSTDPEDIQQASDDEYLAVAGTCDEDEALFDEPLPLDRTLNLDRETLECHRELCRSEMRNPDPQSAFRSSNLDEFLKDRSRLNIGLLMEQNPNVKPFAPDDPIFVVGTLKKSDQEPKRKRKNKRKEEKNLVTKIVWPHDESGDSENEAGYEESFEASGSSRHLEETLAPKLKRLKSADSSLGDSVRPDLGHSGTGASRKMAVSNPPGKLKATSKAATEVPVSNKESLSNKFMLHAYSPLIIGPKDQQDRSEIKVISDTIWDEKFIAPKKMYQFLEFLKKDSYYDGILAKLEDRDPDLTRLDPPKMSESFVIKSIRTVTTVMVMKEKEHGVNKEAKARKSMSQDIKRSQNAPGSANRFQSSEKKIRPVEKVTPRPVNISKLKKFKRSIKDRSLKYFSWSERKSPEILTGSSSNKRPTKVPARLLDSHFTGDFAISDLRSPRSEIPEKSSRSTDGGSGTESMDSGQVFLSASNERLLEKRAKMAAEQANSGSAKGTAKSTLEIWNKSLETWNKNPEKTNSMKRLEKPKKTSTTPIKVMLSSQTSVGTSNTSLPAVKENLETLKKTPETSKKSPETSNKSPESLTSEAAKLVVDIPKKTPEVNSDEASKKQLLEPKSLEAPKKRLLEPSTSKKQLLEPSNECSSVLRPEIIGLTAPNPPVTDMNNTLNSAITPKLINLTALNEYLMKSTTSLNGSVIRSFIINNLSFSNMAQTTSIRLPLIAVGYPFVVRRSGHAEIFLLYGKESINGLSIDEEEAKELREILEKDAGAPKVRAACRASLTKHPSRVNVIFTGQKHSLPLLLYPIITSSSFKNMLDDAEKVLTDETPIPLRLELRGSDKKMVDSLVPSYVKLTASNFPARPARPVPSPTDKGPDNSGPTNSRTTNSGPAKETPKKNVSPRNQTISWTTMQNQSEFNSELTEENRLHQNAGSPPAPTLAAMDAGRDVMQYNLELAKAMEASLVNENLQIESPAKKRLLPNRQKPQTKEEMDAELRRAAEAAFKFIGPCVVRRVKLRNSEMVYVYVACNNGDSPKDKPKKVGFLRFDGRSFVPMKPGAHIQSLINTHTAVLANRAQKANAPAVQSGVPKNLVTSFQKGPDPKNRLRTLMPKGVHHGPLKLTYPGRVIKQEPSLDGQQPEKNCPLGSQSKNVPSGPNQDSRQRVNLTSANANVNPVSGGGSILSALFNNSDSAGLLQPASSTTVLPPPTPPTVNQSTEDVQEDGYHSDASIEILPIEPSKKPPPQLVVLADSSDDEGDLNSTGKNVTVSTSDSLNAPIADNSKSPTSANLSTLTNDNLKTLTDNNSMNPPRTIWSVSRGSIERNTSTANTSRAFDDWGLPNCGDLTSPITDSLEAFTVNTSKTSTVDGLLTSTVDSLLNSTVDGLLTSAFDNSNAITADSLQTSIATSSNSFEGWKESPVSKSTDGRKPPEIVTLTSPRSENSKDSTRENSKTSFDEMEAPMPGPTSSLWLTDDGEPCYVTVLDQSDEMPTVETPPFPTIIGVSSITEEEFQKDLRC